MKNGSTLSGGGGQSEGGAVADVSDRSRDGMTTVRMGFPRRKG
eukprot:CAMPEP_0184401984 /NCGR_PEP_ID=MMETSP0007-20130409/81142_1 /TAXON_ID=97485 /ORGANISM="Prymnesium parvum, Strain Texoma1" /LENGTH=42 /DNA_ID= /DNA_START= /DNA_END= /DNA_ORIENTATION=